MSTHDGNPIARVTLSPCRQALNSSLPICFCICFLFCFVLFCFVLTGIILCYSVGTRNHPRDQHSARSRLGKKLLLKITESFFTARIKLALIKTEACVICQRHKYKQKRVVCKTYHIEFYERIKTPFTVCKYLH